MVDNSGGGGDKTLCMWQGTCFIRTMLCHHFSDHRDVSMAAGHMFWPEGNHVGFFSFILHLIACLFGKETTNNKSFLTRHINTPRKMLAFYNILFKT